MNSSEPTTSITINITRLRVNACLGVLPLEKKVAQQFEVSVSMTLPYDGRDNIDSTANYAEVCNVAAAEMMRGGDLIEHAAARIAAAIARLWPEVTAGSVTVHKLCPPMLHNVAEVSATAPIR